MRSSLSPAAAAALLVPLFLFLAAPSPAEVAFTDQAVTSGIDITWANDYLLGLDFGAGIGIDDYDHDGDLDVFVATKKGQPLGVFQNNGDHTFSDRSNDLNICADRDVKQVLLADLNNDGYRELILATWVPNSAYTAYNGSGIRIYQGLANGTFSQLSSAPIDSFMTGLLSGITAGDADRDGDLDLYLAVWKPGQPDVTCRNRYLRNDGNFQFVDRGTDLGIDIDKKSFMATFADLTNDGWPDIVVAEDKRGGATYYQNNGDGTFTDRSDASGLDGYNFLQGRKIDGMGIAISDYDHDADLDVYITNIFDGNVFYRNDGGGSFTQIASLNGTQSQRTGWGCTFMDCDNDTDQDLYVVDFGAKTGGSSGIDRLFENDGNGMYTDIAASVGITFQEDGFGGACGDLDGNGTVDMVICHGGAPVRVLMNQGPAGNWIDLDLVGTTSNADAVGARAAVYAGSVVQNFEQHAGESYLSTHSHQIEVGLGSATSVDSVVVWWPSNAGAGTTEVWRDLNAGQRYTLREGDSSVPAVAAPNLAAVWVDDQLHVTWSVDDPEFFESFDLLDRGTPLTRIQTQPQQRSYEYVDTRSVADTEYELVAHLRGGNGQVTSQLRPPTATAGLALRVDAPRPNPFNPRVTLRFYLPRAEATTIRILDSRGREVTRMPAPSGAGWHSVIWEGTDAQGRPVASGTYHFLLQSPSGTRSVPMALVR